MLPINKYKIVLGILSIFLYIQYYVAAKEHIHANQKCGFDINFDTKKKDALLRSIKLNENDLPNISHKSFISASNLFKIHYDTTGYNAPSMLDADNNGTPDYIDSVAYYFEIAFQVQVQQIGYISPIPDRGGRGSDHYDIYIWDLGNSDAPGEQPYDRGGLYGLTMFTESDLINYQPYIKTYSFIVIDNDFSATDSVRPVNGNAFPAYNETGISALKITAAHEFQHAIQMMYGLSEPGPITIMEMCAVSMEIRLYPEINDYKQYVKNIFSSLSSYPFGVDDAQTGYGFSIFAKYLLLNYGDNIFKRMWQLLGSGIELYNALDSSLVESGTNLATELTKLTEWIYFTGSRAIEGKYFPDADSLPEIKFDKIIYYTPPSATLSRGTKPLEIGAVRFQIKNNNNTSDDTLDVIYTNTDLVSAHNQFEIFRDYYFQISDEQSSNTIYLSKLQKYLFEDCDENNINFNYFEMTSEPSTSINFAFPNPFNPSENGDLFFPAPDNSRVYEDALLVVYGTDMVPIVSEKGKISVYNTKKVLTFDQIGNNLQDGIYFYGVHTKDKQSFGKFTVTRK